MRFKINKRTSEEFINIDELKNKKIVEKMVKSVAYSPEKYGISAQYTGEGTKILIIDSGNPRHKDIRNQGENHNFAGEDEGSSDTTGHSTIVSGLIAAKNRNSIIGIAPNSKILHAKVVDSKGNSDYNSVVSSILWGIVKEVDIIVMALGSQYDYGVMHDAIIKAYDTGICIFAAAGNHIKEEGSDINFPARYTEVYSVGSLTRSKKINEKILEKVDFALKNEVLISTHLKNKYIKTSGSSVSTALVSGLASLLIEKDNKRTTKKKMPKKIYCELQKII